MSPARVRAEVPAYMSPGEIAECVDETRKKVLNELKACKLIEKRENGRLRIDTSRLRDRLPEYFKRCYAWHVLGHRPNGADVGAMPRTART